MEKKLRIALAQMNPTVGDLAANRNKIVDFIRQAQQMRADIVTFPEMALTGYPAEDLLLKRHFIKDNLKELGAIIRCARDITVIFGFVDRDPKNNIYNAAAIINNARLKGVYHKIELPNYGVFDEKRYFVSGKAPLVFQLGEVIFGVNICEDIWKQKGVSAKQAKQGARLIINISSSPYYAGKRNVRKKMLEGRAQETNAYICYNNLVGGQDELVFDGGSFILDAQGRLLAQGRLFEEDLIIADLAIRVNRNRKTKVSYKNCIRLAGLKHTDKPKLFRREPKKLNPTAQIYHALVLGTKDYIRKNGFKKAVIGLSGGIDSSLTALIARDAVGRKNLIGVSMPSRYSSQATQSDARKLADNLGIRLITVPIDSIFKIYLALLKKEFLGLDPDITEENLQARIRGNILMALSNKFGWLVLTTGNKSETSVGYCTLYGDMAGGYAVIKDVPKRLVYKLTEYRNTQGSNRLIPKTIFTREPSAELSLNQKDTDSLPDYAILDTILKAYIEQDRSLGEIAATHKIKPEIVRDIISRVDKNEYKRRQSPPGIKITPKAFGKDRRLPITNKYTE